MYAFPLTQLCAKRKCGLLHEFIIHINMKNRFITSLRRTSQHRIEQKLYLIRSYDHEKKEEPELAPSRQRKKIGERKNFGQADALEIWQVARAATAAPLYFRPIEITRSTITGKTSTYFSDGGFDHTNNPTEEGRHEIESLHGRDNIGMIVSIGTARGPREPQKNGFIGTMKGLVDNATNPEVVHNQLDSLDYLSGRYWRLNDSEQGLGVELDEWKPSGRFAKNAGSITLEKIRTHFQRWAIDNGNARHLKNCAKELVKRRRARTEDASRWDTYATGAIFTCNCIACVNTRFRSRCDLAQHLRADHSIDDEEIEGKVMNMTKRWRYQVPPVWGGTSG